jgi:hypothetical protein
LWRRRAAEAARQSEAARRAEAIRQQAVADDERGDIRVAVDLRTWCRRRTALMVEAAGSDQPELHWEERHCRLGALYLTGRFGDGAVFAGRIWRFDAGRWLRITPSAYSAARINRAGRELEARWSAVHALRRERAERQVAE